MAIRKPSLSVSEARNLAETRSAAMQNPQLPGSGAQAILPRQPEASPARKPGLAGKAGADKPVTGKTGTSKPAGTDRTMREETRSIEPATRILTPDASLSAQNLRMEKVQVYLSALLPAPGVSQIFEMLCRQYPPQKALQMVLRRAFQEYEAMLQSGSFRNALEVYAINEQARADEFIQTSRMVPRKVVSIARAHFDPLGLESTRSFGRKLASAALANFFAREAMQNSPDHTIS